MDLSGLSKKLVQEPFVLYYNQVKDQDVLPIYKRLFVSKLRNLIEVEQDDEADHCSISYRLTMANFIKK